MTATKTSTSTSSTSESEIHADSSQHSNVESPVELWLTNRIFKPFLAYFVPSWVHPNYLTYTNSLACWCLLGLCMYTSYLQIEINHLRDTQSVLLTSKNDLLLILRILSVILVFLAMMLDCIDGIHARATNQCSKLGEALDHVTDAANTIIFSSTIILLIRPDPISTAYSLVATAAIYSGQSILCRHIRRLIDPPVNGPEAQCLLMLSVSLWSAYYYFLYNNPYYYKQWNLNYYHNWIVFIFIVAGNIGTTQNCLFFKNKLSVVQHARHEHERASSPSPSNPVITYYRYCFLILIFSFLYVFGIVSLPIYLFSFVCFCYRMNGHYVLCTILYQRTAIDEKTQIQLYRRTEYLSWVDKFNGIMDISILLLYVVGYANGPNHVVTTFCHIIFGISCIALNNYDIHQYKRALLETTVINTWKSQ